MEKVVINNESVEYEVSSKDNVYSLKLQGSTNVFDVFKFGNEYLLFNPSNNKFIVLDVYQDSNKTFIWIENEELMIEEETEDFFIKDEIIENVIKSPMPGIIKEIKFKEQDFVKKGDTIVILESMKVLNELKSSVNGTIKKIYVQIGMQVGPLELLVDIEPEEAK